MIKYGEQAYLLEALFSGIPRWSCNQDLASSLLRAWIQFVVREPRSHKLHSAAKKKKKVNVFCNSHHISRSISLSISTGVNTLFLHWIPSLLKGVTQVIILAVSLASLISPLYCFIQISNNILSQK